MKTSQMDFWSGEFGVNYTERSTFTQGQLNQLYIDLYGISRDDMNGSFLKGLSINNILEIGCNVGNQLQLLQSNGYKNLYGIELQEYAVEKAKRLTKGINIIQGSAFDLPFKDNYFDLVFTSGVLIHIAPEDIGIVLKEMVRVSKRFIWGHEYYSDHNEEIDYQGNKGKLWKNNFAALFVEQYPQLKLIKETKFRYLNDSNTDQMFLLEK